MYLPLNISYKYHLLDDEESLRAMCESYIWKMGTENYRYNRNKMVYGLIKITWIENSR